jgi:effector-binding domain-containing protein
MLSLGACIVLGSLTLAGTETPKYEVLENKEGYEIRRYAPSLVAEVTVEAPYREALNTGFRKLADYIFGNNSAPSNREESEKIPMTAPVLEQDAPSEKIAMTAPVIERSDQPDAHVITFVMPSRYTLETLPKPKNDEVTIREVPERKYAVIRFSGRVPEEKAEDYRSKIKELAARDGLKATGEPLLAQYDPPWTPPFLRKTEVWLPVE